MPSRQQLIARFDGRPIRFKDAIVTPSVTAGGDYVFIVAQHGRPEQIFRVDGVIGGGHLVGGGTQGFVSRFPDNTLRFLPFDFIKRENVWFCNTNTRLNKGWIPITDRVALADCGDWPPIRVLGDDSRFANCQGCHGSQITLALDPSERKYDSRFKSLAIDCESCHGPGKEHVELARSGRISETADIGMRPLATLSEDASLDVCFSCHAVKDQVKPGYLAGKSLAAHYSVRFPLLGDENPLFPDGRTRTFAYQQGHLYSDCYLSGRMTCTSCHDPHRQTYRDVNGVPLPDRFSNGQCLSCHASKAEPLAAHTRHRPESPGSRCVSCHMPYLQHPELGRELRFARSDHTIPIPRPAFDEKVGIENACKLCHGDRPIAALQTQVEAWYGRLKPVHPLVAALMGVQRAPAGERFAERVLQPDTNHRMAQFAGLSHYLETALRPDMPSLEAEAVERLKRFARGTDLDLRALALASLHFARGEDPEIRSFLAEQLGALGAQDAAIRERWVMALGFLGDSYRERGDAAGAVASYRKALEIAPRDAQVLLNLGLTYAAAGDHAAAVSQYRQSLEIDANQPLALVNLGLALQTTGDVDAAIVAFERAIEVNPREALAYFNLGNVYLRRQQPARAIPLYQKAVLIDPGLALAHFHLARSHLALREYQEAMAAVRRGLEFDPDNASAEQVLADLERAGTGR